MGMPFDEARCSSEKEFTDQQMKLKDLDFFGEATQGQEQGQQEGIQRNIPRQLENDVQDDATYEHLVMRPYKRRVSTPPRPPKSGIESPSAGEIDPLLSLSTSLSASTCALTALHSGIVTNIGTGITTPDRSDMFGYTSTRKMSGSPRLDEVSKKLRRSYPVDSEAEGQRGGYTARSSLADVPDSSSNVAHAKPQTLEARPVGVSEDAIYTEAHLEVPWATSSPFTQRQLSEEEESSDGSQHKTGLETEVVDSLGISTQKQASVTANINRTEDNNIHKIDLSDLLKTSNRLLEDGRRLLAGEKRQPRPRQAHKSVGEESTGEPIHKGPDGLLRRLSGRQGWYAYELIE